MWVVILLPCGNILLPLSPLLSDTGWQKIPRPSSQDLKTHCNESLLVAAYWKNSAQPWKIVEKRKRYREEGVNDREVV
jgi:hypothetical protein